MSRRRYGAAAWTSGRTVGLRSVHLMPRGHAPRIGFHSNEDESLGILIEDHDPDLRFMMILDYGRYAVTARATVTPATVDYAVLTYDDGSTDVVDW